MSKELDLWQFIAFHLSNGKSIFLLVVVASSGSSPGRAGYKMAVASDGTLTGSIGGGVMEVRLVEKAKSQIKNLRFEIGSELIEQIHRKDSPNSSGMICSGRQTVLMKLLQPRDVGAVEKIIKTLEKRTPSVLSITPDALTVLPPKGGTPNTDFHFQKIGETEFTYKEKLGAKNHLYIVGGGHCSLALSELMSRMDFQISIFDDRPDLNTIEKNRFADEIKIIDGYEKIGGLMPPGPDTYVVVMTLGYKSDEIAIRRLFEKDFKYFGVLGSKAKMKTLLTSLAKQGFPAERLKQIRTPIGLPINSRTPEEIAISIAAEIISVKNS